MYKKLTDDTKAVQTVDCAFDRCPLPARFYVKQKQGYANVCKIHYEELAQREAAAYCRSIGVHTTEQARAYLRETLPKIGRRSSGTWWAHRILERVRNGENMPVYSVQIATEVVSKEPRPRMREPGEDEGEKEEA